VASLGASQSEQFTATVSNTANTGVIWSVNPAVGSIMNGRYTAPSTITNPQTVSIVATSVADPTKSATATVTLIAQISISVSLSPASVSLNQSQTARFTPTVANISNTAVNWTVNPAVGNISNGVYTAPAIVETSQTVTVTATSVADPSKSASSEVHLLPPVAVAVSPSSISLESGQSAQFAADVSNNSNNSVTWRLKPAVGTVVNGKYSAPRRILQAQSVTITATSNADPAKSATAVITLVPFTFRPHHEFVSRAHEK
jgi:hypothetical protein